jgi:hypothetical protein
MDVAAGLLSIGFGGRLRGVWEAERRTKWNFLQFLQWFHRGTKKRG